MHSHLKPIWQMIFFIHTPLPLNKTEEGEGGGMNLIGKQKLFSIIGFSQLFLINRSQDNPPVYLVTMEPLGLMKSIRKQKLFTIIGFFLEIFSWLILTSGNVSKSFGGVVVAFLNIVSSPSPGSVKLKARFGQVGD